MTQHRLTKAACNEDLIRFYPVMHQLRTQLTMDDYLKLYQNAHDADGYEIVALENDQEVLALMGFRVLHDFVHGRHLYIDDLVTTHTHRSQGLGDVLLKHAELMARELGCQGLRLCTGIDNQRGKIFYERHGWNIRAYAFKKKIST